MGIVWKKLVNEAAIRPGMSLKHNRNIDWDPNYGNVLILAGGAGSGKGFVTDMVIDFQGKKFDVDALKESMRKLKPGSAYDRKYFATYGKHLIDTDTTDANDVSNLHQFCKDIGIDDRRKAKFFNDIEPSSRTKPNIIFDVTLKDATKLGEIVGLCKQAGYDARCIHIVWILNEFDTARKQNLERPRHVSNSILVKTHEDVSRYFSEILDRSDDISDGIDGTGIDGDIWVFFNKKGVDNFVKKGEFGGKEMSPINAVKVKSAGKKMLDYGTIMKMPVKEFDGEGNMISRGNVTVGDKIGKYVPATTRGEWADDDI